MARPPGYPPDGQMIIKLRRPKTRVELSELSGVPYRTLERVEQGGNTDYRTLEKIARALKKHCRANVTPEDLIRKGDLPAEDPAPPKPSREESDDLVFLDM